MSCIAPDKTWLRLTQLLMRTTRWHSGRTRTLKIVHNLWHSTFGKVEDGYMVIISFFSVHLLNTVKAAFPGVTVDNIPLYRLEITFCSWEIIYDLLICSDMCFITHKLSSQKCWYGKRNKTRNAWTILDEQWALASARSGRPLEISSILSAGCDAKIESLFYLFIVHRCLRGIAFNRVIMYIGTYW